MRGGRGWSRRRLGEWGVDLEERSFVGGATCGWSKQLPLWCDWMEASPSLPSYFSLSAPTTRSSTPNIYPPWFKISPVTSHSIRRLTQLKTKPHQKQVTGVLSNIPEGTGVRVLEGSASGPGRKPRGEGGGAVDSCGLVGAGGAEQRHRYSELHY